MTAFPHLFALVSFLLGVTAFNGHWFLAVFTVSADTSHVERRWPQTSEILTEMMTTCYVNASWVKHVPTAVTTNRLQPTAVMLLASLLCFMLLLSADGLLTPGGINTEQHWTDQLIDRMLLYLIQFLESGLRYSRVNIEGWGWGQGYVRVVAVHLLVTAKLDMHVWLYQGPLKCFH